MSKDLDERIRQHNSKIINENLEVKAEPTYGMNTYSGMDLVLQEQCHSSRESQKSDQPNRRVRPTAKQLECLKNEAAKESMAQLADRIETDSFQ